MSGADREAPASPAAAADAEAVLDLHAELYRSEAVARAAVAFAPVAACTVERQGPYLRVRLRALGGLDAALLRRQFANWALAASAASLA